MKILIINSVCGIRSTGRIATDIAEQYMKAGHDARIAYGREHVPERYLPIAYRIGNDWDIKINGVKARVFDNEGFNAIRQTKKFISWAEEYNPDLLWLHNLHGYYLNIELLFHWIKTRPQMEIRWTLHDCWPFTGHCSYFSYIKCDQWKWQCSRCQQKKTYPKSVFFDHCTANYQRKYNAFSGVQNMTLITPSQWLADLIKESFLRNYTVKVIHNTIDNTIFRPSKGTLREEYGLQHKKIVLGVASVWNERKGYQDFLKLAQKLDSTYAVVMVGLSQKQMERLPSSIIGIHRTDSAYQLAEIYSAADVFVNMTYEDNYPTVNLEAIACGTRCLTYRTGGSIESVPAEHIVEQGDVMAMAEMIRKLCSEG